MSAAVNNLFEIRLSTCPFEWYVFIFSVYRGAKYTFSAESERLKLDNQIPSTGGKCSTELETVNK